MASEPPKPNIDIGRVIGRGFEALKANFLPFFGFALVFGGIPGFLQTWLLWGNMESITTGAFSGTEFFATWAGGTAATILGFALLQGVITRSTILQLGGRDSDPLGSALYALKLVLPIVGMSICIGFMLILGFIALIVPGIMVWCACAVAVPALVEERRGVFDGIRRSWALTRGSRLWVFVLGVLFTVFSMIVGGIFSTITTTTMFATGDFFPNPIFLGVASGLSTSLTNLISSVILAALYVELREVKEGMRTDTLADVFA